MPQNITFYIARNGRKPFMEWFNELDTETSIIIHERLEKIKTGYFGDHKNLGDGVFELRIHVGAGYRIYFGKLLQAYPDTRHNFVKKMLKTFQNLRLKKILNRFLESKHFLELQKMLWKRIW